MIARRAKVVGLATIKRPGIAVSYYADITCELIAERIVLTPDEHAWAEGVLASGASLVLTIARGADLVSFSVTIVTPGVTGRVLATRVVERLREATAWTERNACTWIGALEPGEAHCQSWTYDADGNAVRCGEISRDPTVPIFWHGRKSLAAMWRDQPPTKTTKTNQGDRS